MNSKDDQRKILREIKEACEKADDCSGCPYEVYDEDIDEHICFFRLAPTFWEDAD
jgi:hypothetical protein